MRGIIKQGDSDSEALLCFGAKFKFNSRSRTVIENYNGFGIDCTSQS